MSVTSHIKGLAGSEYAVGGVYIAAIALLASDIIPTVADAVFFSYTRRLREQYFNHQITPAQYWRRTAIAYYGFNALWWILVLIVVVSIKGDAARKFKVMIALIGAGAVIAVIHNLIKKDEKQQALDQELLIPKQ